MTQSSKTGSRVDLATLEGRRTPSGHFITWPNENTGTMHAYDAKGTLVETREVGDEGSEERMEWEEWAEGFEDAGLNAEEYEDDDE